MVINDKNFNECYGGKPNKKQRAWYYFANFPNWKNGKIAEQLTHEIGKTTKDTVKTYRTEWEKNKNKNTPKDFINSFFDTATNITNEVSNRRENFNNEEIVDLFGHVSKTADKLMSDN